MEVGLHFSCLGRHLATYRFPFENSENSFKKSSDPETSRTCTAMVCGTTMAYMDVNSCNRQWNTS